MTEALLFVGIGSLLLLSIAAIGVAALAYQNARRYVELAEERLEHLREGQAQLLMFLLEERQSLKEELELEREHRVLQKAHQHREVGQESTSPPSERSFAGVPETRGLSREKATHPREEDDRPRLAVWHPHPDDDVSPGSAARAPSDAPVEMFRRHYDKYLENYEGYVKLAKRICRMREDAKVPPGSLAEREWEERLRRVNDGIERTTARLDILEQYNPELVTDDRISHRASIARSHSQLASR